MQRHRSTQRRLGRRNLQAYGIRNNLVHLLGKEIHANNCRQLAKAVISLMETERKENLSWKIQHFWVVKNAPCKQKGDIVFAREHAELLRKNPESKFRDIYCFNKQTRKATRLLVSAMEKFNKIPSQFGFKEHLGVHNAFASIKAGGEFRFYVDLENAFCQITRQQIFWLFHKSLGLSSTKADWLADRMCDSSGHLFQGNSLAPQIFNLLSSTMNKVLNKHLKPLGITVSQYADDLTFSSHKPISLSTRKWIIRLICLTGWKANFEKCEYRKEKAHFKQSLGIVEIRHRGIFAVNQRRMRKLLNYLRHIERKYTKTLKLTPRGNKVEQLIKGFASWLTLVRHLANPSLRKDYYITFDTKWQIKSAIQLSLF